MQTPMNPPEPARIDRRTAIQWMLAAGAGAMVASLPSVSFAGPAAVGYGTDPLLTKAYKAGDFWPLTLSPAQRRQAAALCDTILPADERSPSASSVGVVDFIDEWVSAPYAPNVADAKVVLGGLAWVEEQSARRFGAAFADATDAQRRALCEEMAPDAPAGSAGAPVSAFFRRFRNLTAVGFYTTPVGRNDLGYVGNVPLASFEGPPADLVAKLGLSDEVKW